MLAVLAFVVGALAGVRVRNWLRAAVFTRARRDFRCQREHLEARFFHLASAAGKPHGLRWVHCDFDDDVAYARDRKSGELIAFVGVSIHFATGEAACVEEVATADEHRAATAVFQRADAWNTDGRVIFNLNPSEAIDQFHASLELVGDEPRG
jgi:hypothetical protein